MKKIISKSILLIMASTSCGYSQEWEVVSSGSDNEVTTLYYKEKDALSNDNRIEEANIIANQFEMLGLDEYDASLEEVVCGELDYLSLFGLNRKIHSRLEIRNLYQSYNYRPLWTNDRKVTALAYQLIQSVMRSIDDALLPSMYHSEVFSSLKEGDILANPALFDVILSDAFITYKKHLVNGVINPKTQFKEWNQENELIDFTALYRKAHYEGMETIFKVEDSNYLALKKAYKEQLSNQSDHNFKYLPNKTLRLGDSGENVLILKEKLGVSLDHDLFDHNLLDAVKLFQEVNSLATDGVVGPATISLLNISPGDKLEVLAINMERYRWGSLPKNQNYIWVNIPSYKMAIKNNDDVLFDSKIIVGRKQRQTPVFSDVLQYVVLSPYWNIPRTIYREDKLPQLQRDPNALGSNFEVIRNSDGAVVPSSSVNWQTEWRSYRLRQLPGRYNSLGRMKFLFPNEHDIYLHDTPNRGLFNRDSRDYSSGCVRVEKAQDLANYLLGQMGWGEDRVAQYSSRTKEKWVTLKEELNYPVFLNYYTAWVDDKDNSVRFSLDIYDKDKKLIQDYQQFLTKYN